MRRLSKALNGSPRADTLHFAIRAGCRRWRLQQTKTFLFRLSVALAAGMLLWLCAIFFFPFLIEPLPAVTALAGAAVAATLLTGLLLPIDRKTILHKIDQCLKLPDLALSAGELDPATPNDTVWADRQWSQAEPKLASARWSEVWPAPWPRGTALAFSIVLTLSPLLFYIHRTESGMANLLALTSAHDLRRVTVFESLFEDWEMAANEVPSEEFKALLEKIAPLRERLLDPKASDKELFVQLSHLEEIVSIERARIEAQSLAPHAEAMAQAVEPMEGMGALAAALRGGNFERAQKLAADLEAQLAAEGATPPKGAAESAEKAARLAEKLPSGQKALGDGLRKLSEGAKQGNSRQMASGMKQMQNALARQNSANRECQRMATQLSQLAQCKECMGAGERPGFSEKIAQGNSGQGGSSGENAGSQAGTQSADQAFGEETSLDAQRTAENVTGALSEGESETTTLQGGEGVNEGARATKPSHFREYEKLSREAIDNEKIPIAHRQTIRRYFERIRPEDPH